MIIRQIQSGDRAEWLRLRVALWPECPGPLHRIEMEEYLAASSGLAVFVAERPRSGLGGFLEANIRPFADGCDTRPVGYIEGWFVDEDLRREGIGRELVKAAETWAAGQGCREMASDCVLGNDVSLLAHHALGYHETERLIHFCKVLEPARSSDSVVSSAEDLYGNIWGRPDAAFDAAIGRSLEPRSADVLYDLFGKLGVGPEHRVLDIGCRDAGNAAEIVRRFGCHCTAVDVVPLYVEMAVEQIQKDGMEDKIEARIGRIESLPLQDSSVDYIWCRDMLNHVDLPAGFAECARVLRPGGFLFIFMTFGTDLCEPKEALRLYRSMAILPENMSAPYFEAQARQAGFEIAAVDRIDSEWRENWIEHGETTLLEELLRVARLRRQEQSLVQQYGRKRYEAFYGSSLWGIYQMLGKLCPTVYVLRKPTAPPG